MEPQEVSTPIPTYITWTLFKLSRFRSAYKTCKGDSFTFEGHEFLKAYAKYLIEYLETQL